MIAAHIGAGKFKKEEQEACRRQCENSCILGIELLKQNEVAEAVCHQVMRALESSDLGNLGSSANLTHNNKRMLEAGIYNVTENIYGGVAGISDSIYASDAAMNVYESQNSSVPSLIRPVYVANLV